MSFHYLNHPLSLLSSTLSNSDVIIISTLARCHGSILTFYFYFCLVSQGDPAKTVQIFIDLVQRHEQSFYSFVHKVHSKGEGLFDNLMRWIERFLTLMREGLSGISSQPPISLEFLLPHTGTEREGIMREVDEVARYHYKLKLAYEAKVRRRFGRTQAQGVDEADKEDEAVASMVNDVVSDLSFGDLVKGDADDLAAEATDEEDSSGSSDEDSSDEESSGEEESESDEDEEGDGDRDRDSDGESSDGGKLPTPVARSQTLGHSPLDTRPRASPLYPHQKQSLDIPPTPSKSPIPSPVRSARSMTVSSPIGVASSSSLSKPLPPPPHLGRQREREAKEGTSTKKRKKPEGPKPPELEHLPKLLPLFVEMVSPTHYFIFIPS